MCPTDAFDDSDALAAPGEDHASLVGTFESLIRAQLDGVRPTAAADAVRQAAPRDRGSIVMAIADVFANEELRAWIQASPRRQAAAVTLVKQVTPADPSPRYNQASIARCRSIGETGSPYAVIVVPGFTPADRASPERGVHPIAMERLEKAVRALRSGLAPFVLVSGGNVYPRGTPYFEAIEMRAALCEMGVGEDEIFVEARARHTTTNLRNAGRVMRALGLSKALIVTTGGGVPLFGQDFYLAHPTISTFHGRCERDLGYRVGTLEADEDRGIAFVPSSEVTRFGYQDPLDP